MEDAVALSFYLQHRKEFIILITVKTHSSTKRHPWAWIPTLYTAEGIPYVIVMSVATVMYERMGLSNAQIALYTSWLYLPWVIKPFWSPFVDLLRTKRWWIVIMQLFIGASLGGLAFSMQLPTFLQCSLCMLWLMAFSSATHDIAADGFYMLALTPQEQAFFVGIRSTFYRIASIVGQGLLIMFAGVLESRFRPSQAWSMTFAITAIVFLVLCFYHTVILPRPAADHATKNIKWHSVTLEFVNTFITFFRKPQIEVAMLFILLYRLPEALLVKICPLFMLDNPSHGGLGLTTGELGLVQGTVGVIGLTLGGIIGGWAAEHGGLRRWLWPMVLSITLPDAVYIGLAYFQPEIISWVNVCVFIEQFGYGFGFTAYMLYLISFSRGESSTAHYAFCTGFMALGMMLPGMIAGYLQEMVGYLNFFIITMVLCIATFAVARLIKIDNDFDESDDDDELTDDSEEEMPAL